MSDAVDIASLAGTWVGAGIGLFGLIAVVGPLLIFWASRTERHRALKAIGRKNNGYLSAGIPVWPGIRFWQSAHPPDLRQPKSFTAEEWRDFDLKRLKGPLPESSATWVQFGACIEAYGVKVRRGGELVLDDKQLKLRVHKMYLWMFLVLGRYQDKLLGSLADNRVVDVARKELLLLSMPRIAPSTDDYFDSTILHGLTGSFRFDTYVRTRDRRRRYSSDSVVVAAGQARFTENLEKCVARIPADDLPVSSILLLARGFLPLPSGQVIGCVLLEENAASGIFDDDRSSQSSVSESDDERERAKNAESHATPVARAENRARRRFERLTIDIFELGKKKLEMPELLFGSTVFTKEALVLGPMTETTNIQGHLQKLASMTFIPAQEPFLRVRGMDTKASSRRRRRRRRHSMDRSRGRREESEDDEWDIAFLDRKSAQLFALALLKLAWSENNYIVGVKRDGSLVWRLLTQAASNFLRFLVRLKRIPDALCLERAQLSEVLAALDKVMQHDLDLAALCELDRVLATVQHSLPEVSLMVGVLLLTNDEFRELVYHATRHIQEGTSNIQDAETVVNFDTGHVVVAGAFGVKHTFVVDMENLTEHLPDYPLHNLGHSAKISFAAVLLASLKAYLRSHMLSRCIDGETIESVMNYEHDTYDIS